MQSERGSSRTEPRGPSGAAWFIAGTAALLTLLNAAKPLTIDDPIYYALASQIARAPFDPYGFTIHWYQSPQPAFDILLTPGLSYWLAIPVRLFSGSPLACKLWLFPFSLLLVVALHDLFRRWARGLERPLVVLTTFSAAVLPGFNLMLDVPALALSLGALAVLARAVDRDRIGWAIWAGVLAGVASETKYTGLLSPVVLIAYAAVHRRRRLGVLAAAVALLLFGAWEAFMVHVYGDSHFHHHWDVAAATPVRKLGLTLGLLSDLGGIGAPVVLLALAALGFARTRLIAVAGILCLGYAGLAAASPRSDLVRVPVVSWRITVAVAICGLFGIALLSTLCAVAARLARRRRRDVTFLILWLALELVGFYAFTPFPAARRVLGVFVVAILLLGRLASRTCRSPGRRQVVRAIAACGVVFGLLVDAVDIRDAAAAPSAVERARERIGATAPDATIWYAAHWGFQYYADRAGMREVAPGESRIRRGDWLLTVDSRYQQPHVALPAEHWEPIEPAVEIRDWIPIATVGNYYLSDLPLRPQRGPRFRVWLYRARDDFVAMP